MVDRKRAENPEDLLHLIIVAANAGDLDGVVAVYEPDAVLATGAGTLARGLDEIRAFYRELLSGGRKFDPGEPRKPIVRGNLAMTSTRLPDGTVTAEVAKRQPDGSWLWIIDQPAIAGSELSASPARDPRASV